MLGGDPGAAICDRGAGGGRRRSFCARRLQAAQLGLFLSRNGQDALKLLPEAGDAFGLLVVSEVMEISQSN